MTVTLVARRSRLFAGTRFKKRGLSDQGKVRAALGLSSRRSGNWSLPRATSALPTSMGSGRAHSTSTPRRLPTPFALPDPAQVANEVEVEQILDVGVHHGSGLPLISSIVQVRHMRRAVPLTSPADALAQLGALKPVRGLASSLCPEAVCATTQRGSA